MLKRDSLFPHTNFLAIKSLSDCIILFTVLNWRTVFVKKYRSLQLFGIESGSSAPKGRKELFILTVKLKCKLHNKSVYPNTDLFHVVSG